MKPEFTLLDDEVANPEKPITLSQLLAQQQPAPSDVAVEEPAPSIWDRQRSYPYGKPQTKNPIVDVPADFGMGLVKQGVKHAAALPADAVDLGVFLGNKFNEAVFDDAEPLELGLGDKVRGAFDTVYGEPVSKAEELGGTLGKWIAPAGVLGGAKTLASAGIGALADIFGTEVLDLDEDEAEMLGLVSLFGAAGAKQVGKTANWLTKRMGPSLRDRYMQSTGHKSKQIKEVGEEAYTKLKESTRWVRENYGPKGKQAAVLNNDVLSEGPRVIIPKAEELIAKQQAVQKPIIDAIDAVGGEVIDVNNILPKARAALESAPKALRKQVEKQFEMYDELITEAALGSKPATELLNNAGYLSDSLEKAFPKVEGVAKVKAAIKEDLVDMVEAAANKVEAGSGAKFRAARKEMDHLIEYKRGVERVLTKVESPGAFGERPPVAAAIGNALASAPEAIAATGAAASKLPGMSRSAYTLPGVVGDMNYTPVEEGPPPAFALQPENELAPQEAAFELLPDDLATPVEQMPVNGAMAPSGGAFQGVAYNPEIPPQSLPRTSDDFFSIAEEALGPLLEDPEIADLMQQAKSGPPVIKRTALAGIIEKRPELFPPVDHPYLSGYTIVDRHIVSADKAIQYGQREMYADDLKRRVDAGLVSRSTYAKALSSLNTDGYVMELDMPIDKVSQYDDIIEDAAKEFNLPPNLIRAVIRQESSGNANATGPQTKYGVARGLMQIMQSATDEVAKMGIKVTDPYDPKQNIRAGAAYLAKNIERVKKTWKGEDANDLYSKALGAYHSGIGNLTKVGYDVSKLGPQGRAYVKKVMKNFSTYSELLDDNYPIEDRANAIDALASQKKPSTSA